jgi:hypothetical protein
MTFSKQEMLAKGIERVKAFCELNSDKLFVPSVTVLSKSEWRFSSTCAYYRPTNIVICPDRCATIGKAGRAWSYPGYMIDRTPFGVMAHELGHHVDWALSTPEARGSYGGDFSMQMRLATNEPKLTGYCPNDWEWFAEMFRLFVTNSDLLRAVRPKTYTQLVSHLKPVETRPWREVLAGAPERTIVMAGRRANDC